MSHRRFLVAPVLLVAARSTADIRLGRRAVLALKELPVEVVEVLADSPPAL